MTTLLVTPELQKSSDTKLQLQSSIDDLIASLPNPSELTSGERRGIIARYTAVLEPNFIYWMTATYLPLQCEEGKPIILDNLREEIADCHPLMLRKFALAADAFPSAEDAMAVNDELTRVRLFLGRLQPVQSLLTMAFFEGFIQRFMPFLADLAKAQGSTEMVYTDVHGVCDVAHSEGLFLAFVAELELNPQLAGTNLYEGVDLLQALIRKILSSQAA